ncbi:chlorohydrolase [Streptococcus pneumoniae]|nr:chlorohydrolase [Streptococcus pneumoniae]
MTQYPFFYFENLYSMKIKEQTRKLAAGCSKQCFEVADRIDDVSSRHCFEVADRTDEVSNHTYGKVKLTWFEEIFEEY